MMEIPFIKYSGSGNDFVIIDNRNESFLLSAKEVIRVCKRREGIGADGVVYLNNSSQGHDFSIQIFNADGSEAEMCGNASRSVVHYAYNDLKLKTSTKYTFDTMNGVYYGEILGDEVKIKMTELYDVDAIDVSDLSTKASLYLNTGVPHTVLQVNNVDDIKIEELGSVIRYDSRFPSGTNVGFFEVVKSEEQSIKLRVYERGVEAETLCCGTGIMAAAITCSKKLGWIGEIKVVARGGVLKAIVNQKLDDLYFQGIVQPIYKGSFQSGR
jgi:diaminopimelate epimerase